MIDCRLDICRPQGIEEQLVDLAQQYADFSLPLRILALLQWRPACGCEIVELTHLPSLTIERSLYRLHQMNLVRSESRGRFTVYSLAKDLARDFDSFSDLSDTSNAWVTVSKQAEPTVFEGLISCSAKMVEVFQTIERISLAPLATVLITGESGVGKDLIARAIHVKSRGREAPFVSISCATLQPTLLESELFGHEKGAFTDAKDFKPGLFEVANTGTLFLDDVQDLDLSLQGKLLRTLEHRTIRRLGGVKEIAVDTKVVAATNLDLREAVKRGRFREDLYHRLNVIPIHVPALRERPEDILPLVRSFISSFSERYGLRPKRLSAEVERALLEYGWPGNVRELKNLTERLVLLCEGQEVHLVDLPDELKVSSRFPSPPISPSSQKLREILREVKVAYLHDLLTRYRGNVYRSAKEAGLDPGTFRRLLRRLGLSPHLYRQPDQ